MQRPPCWRSSLRLSSVHTWGFSLCCCLAQLTVAKVWSSAFKMGFLPRLPGGSASKLLCLPCLRADENNATRHQHHLSGVSRQDEGGEEGAEHNDTSADQDTEQGADSSPGGHRCMRAFFTRCAVYSKRSLSA